MSHRPSPHFISSERLLKSDIEKGNVTAQLTVGIPADPKQLCCIANIQLTSKGTYDISVCVCVCAGGRVIKLCVTHPLMSRHNALHNMMSDHRFSHVVIFDDKKILLQMEVADVFSWLRTLNLALMLLRSSTFCRQKCTLVRVLLKDLNSFPDAAACVFVCVSNFGH